ncbi:UbiA family prenyltransferase [Granulosicoccus sp. 3-233]|uniref:UbiA family prenyltransferase n=1 Tax=Granulosicoccus sp. 3-233 TaxID=3417969 RepID=UPI003D342ED9
MSWTTRTAFELGRVSNLPTAWTNTAAGMLLSGAAVADWRFPVLLLAMTSAYTGGMFLNDAFDAEIDSRKRPERPIPSGKVSRRSVFIAGFSMLALSILLVSACALSIQGGGWTAVIAAFFLCATITLYNAWHKGNTLGPVIMGACRLLVYLTAGLSYTSTPDALLYAGAVISLCYLIGLTYTAKQESLGEVRNMWPLLFLLTPVLFGLYGASIDSLVFLPLLLLIAWLLVVMRYLRRRHSGDIPRAVVSMIAGISLMDAVFVATLGNIGWVMFCIAGFLVTMILQKWISGT